MNVIGHQTIRLDAETEALALLAKHFKICVVSTATGALPGFLSECGQLHPLSDSALRAGV